MKEIKINRQELANLWQSMQSKDDLLSLLNKTLELQYDEKAKPIGIKQLNYHTYSSVNKKRYISFLIPKKKRGEFRAIDAPCEGLKTIQQCLNILFQSIYMPHVAAMGFIPKRSVVDGARVHLHQRYVYNIDLKDFFPSVTAGRLFKRLQSKPFGLKNELASIVTDLCCYTNAEGKNVLPQGAPTSPTITNFICERLDWKLSKLASAYNLKYTRYADDITFSGMTNVFSVEGKFCKSLKHIVEEEEHFTINPEKTRLLHRGNRQEVTGITVNSKPNVPRKYVKQLRTLVHNWEVKGYDEAQQIFLKHYHPTKNIVSNHYIENIIAGKLDYLKMVKGSDDNTYKSLNERFETLRTGKFQPSKMQKQEYITTVLPLKSENDILKEFDELSKLLK